MDGFNIAIARSTLPQVAAERLRALIIEGILAPGARLNERELSEQLGLSRTPLREAFRLLAAEGLLLQLPNRGVQVVALSREDVRHAFEVMASLEGLAGELAAARVTDADLDDLRALQGGAGEGAQAARPAGLLPRQPRHPRPPQRHRRQSGAGPDLPHAQCTPARTALPLQPERRQVGSGGGGTSFHARPPLRRATALGYVTSSSGICTPSFRRCWTR